MTTNVDPQWDVEAVLAAANEWSWVPDFAHSIRTDEYLVVAYPESFLTPTGARLLGSDRDPAALLDEVHAAARDLGRDRLWWTLSDTTRPEALEAALSGRGAQVIERMDVLALDLTHGLPHTEVGDGVTANRVTDRDGVRHALEISQSAFGGNEPDDDEVALSLTEIDRGLADGTSGRVDTSSPILRGLGFRRYGEQRQLVIDL